MQLCKAVSVSLGRWLRITGGDSAASTPPVQSVSALKLCLLSSAMIMKHMSLKSQADILQGRKSTANGKIDTVAQRKGGNDLALGTPDSLPGDLGDKIT